MDKHGITHTARIKTYSDGTSEVLCASVPIFREPGWEARSKRPRGRAEAEEHTSESEYVLEAVEKSIYALEREEELSRKRDSDSLQRAKRRARTNVRDYAMCSDFSYFVTLTLDASKVDRYDVAEVTKKLNVWADNQVRRKGLAYILVPELHKDGAIHFHGFFNKALPVVDSGTMIPPDGGKPRRPRSAAQRAEWASQGGRVVYNLPGWTLGYTTAIELYGERSAAVGYVCKYITKAQTKVGGRWYYSGGELSKPDVLFTDLDMDQLREQYGDQLREFEVESLTGVRFCTLRVKGGE